MEAEAGIGGGGGGRMTETQNGEEDFGKVVKMKEEIKPDTVTKNNCESGAERKGGQK